MKRLSFHPKIIMEKPRQVDGALCCDGRLFLVPAWAGCAVEDFEIVGAFNDHEACETAL